MGKYKKQDWIWLTSLITILLPCLGAAQEGQEAQEGYTLEGVQNEPQEELPLLKGVVLLSDESPLLSFNEVENIDGLKVVNLNWFDNSHLLALLLQPYLDLPLTSNNLQRIKNEITQYCITEGHPLVAVISPPQDVTSGVVQLQISESTIGAVNVEGARWTSTKRMLHYLNLTPGKPLNEDALIRALNFINRNPFRNADIIYSPGIKSGTTDVTLFVKDRRQIRVYAGCDNSGFPILGRTRVFAGFNWGNAFNLDHILSYQYTASTHFHRLQAHTFQYIAPLSWKHVLNVYGGYSKVHVNFPSPLVKHGGYSIQTSVRYAIPFILSRYLRDDIILGFDFKRTNSTDQYNVIAIPLSKNTNLTQLVLGYLGHYERDSYRLDFNTDVYWSPGTWLADQSNADYRSLRPGAKKNWVYANAKFSYLQKLNSFGLLLNLMLRGQISDQNLLPSEQLGIGGFDTVRGYEEREINKDNGVIANGEFRIPIPFHFVNTKKVHDVFQALVFVDYGWGRNHSDILGQPKQEWLLGAGPGLRYTIEPYFTARLDWGIKLHHNPVFTGQHSFVYFSVVGSY